MLVLAKIENVILAILVITPGILAITCDHACDFSDARDR
jgi:hypothetical protein